MKTHLSDAIASGADASAAIRDLGPAADVADRAYQEHQELTGVDIRRRYVRAKRVLQVLAAALAVAAALAIIFLPSYIVTSESSSGGESVDSATALEVVGGPL
ncbi:hypothetical protein [Microlunatus sp. GCM10028923]|uniref:hypothetical protein n=1 Tax=Microlunatus sp. GCM10028923 TaxID=3273400 RepID=UPI003612EBEF